MKRLRGRGGCPWDRKQNHKSLRPYLIEETYEVLDAIDRGNDTDLKEELGDLLLQVVFHARLAEERGKFSLRDVIDTVNRKLIERHPHVFGGKKVRGVKDVLENWEKIKRKTSDKNLFEGIPPRLPSLLRSYRLIEKFEHTGWKYPEKNELPDDIIKLTNEILSGKIPKIKKEKLFGRLFFLLVILARENKIEMENTLRQENNRFEKSKRDL